MIDRYCILRVTSPYFCAGALWRKTNGKWECFLAAPTIKWMKGMIAKDVKKYLGKRKWDYQWIY